MVEVNKGIELIKPRKYKSFGAWRLFDYQPTQEEIDRAVFDIDHDNEQFIKENGWEDKSFSKTVVVKQKEAKNDSLNPPCWIVALRFDEVVN